MQKNWYAVYTKPRCEKKVAALLTKKKIEIYCPLNRIIKKRADYKKPVFDHLFPSYVFVHTTDLHMQAIRQTEGVINFVYWLGKPAAINETEIAAIKNFTTDYEFIKLEKTEVNANEPVQTTEGSLINMEGTVVSMKNKIVRVMLPSLGYTMCTEVEKSTVRLVVNKSLTV